MNLWWIASVVIVLGLVSRSILVFVRHNQAIAEYRLETERLRAEAEAHAKAEMERLEEEEKAEREALAAAEEEKARKAQANLL